MHHVACGVAGAPVGVGRRARWGVWAPLSRAAAMLGRRTAQTRRPRAGIHIHTAPGLRTKDSLGGFVVPFDATRVHEV